MPSMSAGSHLEEHEITPHTPQSEENSRRSGSLRSLIAFALIVILVVVPIRLFVAKPFIVSGTSMYPTFNTWHYLIIDQITYRFETPQRGDVVVFRFPQNPSRFFIKRIIGMPNETVTLSGTTVTIINEEYPEGFILDEPYLSPEYLKESEIRTTLGDNEYFVMGDNRKASADSRYWGPLEVERIVGRALVRLFPFSEIDLLPGAVSESNLQNATSNE